MACSFQKHHTHFSFTLYRMQASIWPNDFNLVSKWGLLPTQHHKALATTTTMRVHIMGGLDIGHHYPPDYLITGARSKMVLTPVPSYIFPVALVFWVLTVWHLGHPMSHRAVVSTLLLVHEAVVTQISYFH